MHLTASCQSPALPRKLVLQKAFSVGHCRHTALLQRSLRICTEAGRQCNRNCVTTTNPHGIGWSFSDWVFQCWQCNTCTRAVQHWALANPLITSSSCCNAVTCTSVRFRMSPENIQCCAGAAFVNLRIAASNHHAQRSADLLVVFATLGSGLSYVECRMHQPSLNMFSSNSGRKDR
jgi:hypothetical protein